MQSNKKKILAWIALPISILTLLFFLLKPSIENYLAERIGERLKGVVEYEQIQVKIFEHSIDLIGVSWEKLKHMDTVQLGTIAELQFKDLALFTFIFDRKNVVFDEVSLKGVQVELFDSAVDSTTKSAAKPYSFVKEQINRLKIKSLLVESADITWFGSSGQSKAKIMGITLRIEDFELDSVSAEQNNGWFSFDAFNIESDASVAMMNKELHQFTTGKIEISSENQDLRIDSLQILPLYSKNKLAHQYGYQTNWMQLTATNLKLSGFHLKELLFHKKTIASQADLNGVKYHAYRDKSLAYHPDLHTTLPQLAFKSLPLQIDIDTFSIQNAYFQYEEYVPTATESGIVYFDNADVMISNFSNIAEGEMKIHATADLYGQSRLTADFLFPMDNENGLHYVSGNLAEMDMKYFNQTFEPLASYWVDSGKLNQLSFDFNADLTSSEGKLNLVYNDLKIQLMKNGGSDKTPLWKEFSSFLTNKVLINNSNGSMDAESSYTANIGFERHSKKSIFNYWWKSIFSGIKSTVMKVDFSSRKNKD